MKKMRPKFSIDNHRKMSRELTTATEHLRMLREIMRQFRASGNACGRFEKMDIALQNLRYELFCMLRKEHGTTSDGADSVYYPDTQYYSPDAVALITKAEFKAE